jgi:hypothetical protein
VKDLKLRVAKKCDTFKRHVKSHLNAIVGRLARQPKKAARKKQAPKAIEATKKKVLESVQEWDTFWTALEQKYAHHPSERISDVGQEDDEVMAPAELLEEQEPEDEDVDAPGDPESLFVFGHFGEPMLGAKSESAQVHRKESIAPANEALPATNYAGGPY